MSVGARVSQSMDVCNEATGVWGNACYLIRARDVGSRYVSIKSSSLESELDWSERARLRLGSELGI